MDINFVKAEFEMAKSVSHLSKTIVIDIKTIEWLIEQVEESKELIEDRTNDIVRLSKNNQKLRERNTHLDTLCCMYRNENRQFQSRIQFLEGYTEKLESNIERLKGSIKSALETEPQGEEDEEMVLNSMKSFLQGVLDGKF